MDPPRWPVWEGLLEGQEVVGTTGGDPGRLSQPDDTILVRLSKAFDDSKIAERHFIATASCGSPPPATRSRRSATPVSASFARFDHDHRFTPADELTG